MVESESAAVPSAEFTGPAGFADLAGFAGLGSEEAKARLAEFGPNELVERARGARLGQWLRTLADPMALMLAGAALLYLLLGKPHEAAVLAAVIIPVLGVDVLMEARSRDALRKLAGAVAPRARALRDGRPVELPTAGLVPGDLLLFREGDILHADGIVRRAANLAVDESQLTGEAEPREKTAHPGAAAVEDGEQCRFFAGSMVLAGQGVGEITATGRHTRLGNIARLVGEGGSQATPLQLKTARAARWLIGIALGLSVTIFAVRWLAGAPPGEALLYSVSLAMSAVCEEMVVVLSLFLTLAALRLSREGVLVKRLASVETLGSTTVICLDKTGTLTAGKFALEAHRPLEAGRLGESALLEAAALACEPGAMDSLEREILAHCRGHGVDVEALHDSWRLAYDYPFDVVGKHMSHVWMRAPASAGAAARIVAKGALEGILEHCGLAPGERARALAMNSELAGQGMRVLAVAGRFAAVGDSPDPGAANVTERRAPGGAGFRGVREDDERELVLYGLLGFRDPLRPEVPAAVDECQSAGIKLKLITGDHALTAHAVAEAAGIAHDDSLIVNGAELARLSPEAAAKMARDASIFARAQPEQKYQIVDALVRAGEIVAMIGDGINDAPALRRAHIGVSMGRRGTEVARAAADLILLEDNFAALVHTVREGRRVFGNIQHSLRYLTGFKFALVALALLAPAFGLPILLLPVVLVWLELIVHPVSALAFEGEPGPPDLMKRPPRDPHAPLISRARLIRSALSGALLTVAALAWYAARLDRGEPYARAGAMVVVILGSLFLMWAELAGDRPWWRTPLPARASFWMVSVLVAASLPLFMALGPVAALLQIAPIAPRDWAIAGLLAVAPVLWRVAGAHIPSEGRI
ncbi:MAG TPA: cation-transporting P-type ATPase [Candidatus Binataceae bacterium]|nr:cation-transporting P-type ATPase [Candidatus Binataceae bacterium]